MFADQSALLAFTTLSTLQLNKLTATEAILEVGIQIQVFFQLSLFTLPLASVATMFTFNLSFGARFKRMTLTSEFFVAMYAFDLHKRTTITLTTRSELLIEVLVKLSQFSCPLTTITAVGTVHVKLGEGLLQPLVGEGSKR